MRLSACACRAYSFIQATVRIVSTVGIRESNLRARRGGPFAIKVHQVGQDWLCAELPQERRDLPAVIAPVIDEMLHRLPERIAVNTELQGLVFHRTIQVGLRQPANKTDQPRLLFVPALFQTRDVFELRCVRQRRGRAAWKAFQPDTLRSIDIRERTAPRPEARTNRLTE